MPCSLQRSMHSRRCVQGQEVEAEDINTAGPQTVGHALQMTACRCFAQQVAKSCRTCKRRHPRAGSGRSRPCRRKHRGSQLPPRQPPLQVIQRGPVQIEARHAVAAGGQFGHQSARAARRLEQPPGRKGAILAARGLDEVGLASRFRLECDVVILRIVVPTRICGKVRFVLLINAPHYPRFVPNFMPEPSGLQAVVAQKSSRCRMLWRQSRSAARTRGDRHVGRH